MRIPASLITLAVLTACAHGGSAERPTARPKALFEGTPWRLVAFEGHRLPEGDGARAITLRFESGRVWGQAPCNSLSGPYARDGDALRLGSLATSKRLCPGEPSELEPHYLEALRMVQRVRFDNDALVLEGPGVSLRLRADPSAR